MIAKKIPGNKKYRIDLKGRVFDFHGNIVNLPVKDKSIRIELFGKERWVELEWLSLLAWYECGYIHSLEHHLDKISFLPIASTYLRTKCKRLIVFSEPIYYTDGFRYIATHCRFAINREGNVIDTFTNELEDGSRIDNYGYPSHYIRYPDRNMNRAVRTHRLLATAWLPNEDYNERPVINHIDGVKTNNALDNLEWASASENVQHALATGLIGTQVATKVRDIRTGVVSVYRSFSDMNRELGLSLGVSSHTLSAKLPGFLWDKNYEIKLASDESPWFYEKADPSDFTQGKSYYIFTVTDKESGEKRIFNGTTDIARVYSVPKISPISDFVLMFKERLPSMDITYDRNAIQGPYYVYDKNDKSLTILKSIAKVSEHTGRSRAEIQLDLTHRRRFIYAKRWIINTKETFKNCDYSEYADKPIPFSSVEVTDTNENKTYVVRSMKRAANVTGITFKTVQNNINTGKSVKGFIFRALDQ